MAIGLIVYDLLYVALLAALYGGAAISATWVHDQLIVQLPLIISVPIAILAGLVSLIAAVGVLTALLPRVRPGRYDLMKGAVVYSWLLRSLLRRCLLLPLVKTVIFSSNILRFLALRALGARVAFTANMSSDVDVLDPCLLEVGAGATIGAKCLVSGHYIDKGQLVLGAVEIGPKALLAAEVLIAPDTKIGANVRILPQAALGAGVEIGDGAVIYPRCLLEGQNRIAPRARVPIGTIMLHGEEVERRARKAKSEPDQP
jgi:carbonic anhydrase/acetyltransferase-like protein (isoleucine patch superfamily)